MRKTKARTKPADAASNGGDGIQRKKPYFDIDENEYGGPATDAEFAPLTWRLDPEESLSDWTIVVRVGTDGGTEKESTTSYHVHRNILAIGPRKSQYFTALFRTKHVVESRTNTSDITLEPSAAASFPLFLDFLYSPKVKMTTDSAVSLRYLAQYFDCRSLLSEVTAFIRDDLTVKTAPIYLAEAAVYRDERLLSAALNVCAENLECIYVGLLAALPVGLLRMAICHPRLKCSSKWLSKVIGQFCRNHPESVTRDFLLDVTSKERMPEIMAEEALFLLKLCAKHGHETSDTSDEDLACLRKRCINACVASWKEQLARPVDRPSSPNCNHNSKRFSPSRTHRQHDTSYHKTLPTHVQIEMLESGLTRARQDLDEVISSKNGEIKNLKNELKAKGRQLSGLSNAIEMRELQVRELEEALAKSLTEVQDLRSSVEALKLQTIGKQSRRLHISL